MNEVINELRAALHQAADDANARIDQGQLSERLIAHARNAHPAGRAHRRWVAPLLAAAAVVLLAGGIAGFGASRDSRTGTVATQPAPSQSSRLTAGPTSTVPTTGSSTPSAATSEPIPSEAQTTPVTLGPNGFGALKLGMTLSQAQQSGVISSLADSPSIAKGEACQGIYLKAISTRAANAVDGYVSAKYGVVYIVAGPNVPTPEGISVGSTLTALRAAYPNLVEGQGGPRVQVPGNAAAQYQFAYDPATSIIVRVSLVADLQNCSS